MSFDLCHSCIFVKDTDKTSKCVTKQQISKEFSVIQKSYTSKASQFCPNFKKSRKKLYFFYIRESLSETNQKRPKQINWNKNKLKVKQISDKELGEKKIVWRSNQVEKTKLNKCE